MLGIVLRRVQGHAGGGEATSVSPPHSRSVTVMQIYALSTSKVCRLALLLVREISEQSGFGA